MSAPRPLIAAGVAAAVFLLLATCSIPVLIGATLPGGGQTDALGGDGCLTAPLGASSQPSPAGPNAQLPGLATDTATRAEQYADAQVIIGVGKAAGVGDRAVIIALMTAMQESTLLNLHSGDRDSVGLFQQRPSSGWGTVAELTTPAISARKFFAALTQVPGWQSMPLTEAAQSVQRSAFPLAYAKWEPLARSVYAVLSGIPADLAALASPAGCWGGPALAVAAGGSCPTGPNGQLPDSTLAPLPTAPGQRLCKAAAAAFAALDQAYAAQFGTHICVTDAYRSLAEQYAVKASRGAFAATPGHSNHGLGRALDLGCGINSWGSQVRNWMVANGPRFGWHSPDWAQPGSTGPEEPWHWEFATP